MTYLINRTPVARFRCLHALAKFVKNKHDMNKFYMGSLLYDSHKINIHKFCDLIKEDFALRIKYCPFLDNPLSKAGCYLTRGVDEDTTKRKEISNSVNALDGLGFINRVGRNLQLTNLGSKFADTQFQSHKCLRIMRESLLKYGPMIGLLYQIHTWPTENFESTSLKVGYPDTGETMVKEGKTIIISSGSQKDSNTRTKSTLLAWAVTVGFIAPYSLQTKVKEKTSQTDTHEYMLRSVRNERSYVKKYLPDGIFLGNFITERPLDYNNLLKNIGALREHGQAVSRSETLRCRDIILNRRFALAYLLNKAFFNKCGLDFSKMSHFLKKQASFFVVNKDNFENVMKLDSFSAYMVGIPFKRRKNHVLYPVTGLNEKILCLNAPSKVINFLDNIVKEVLF